MEMVFPHANKTHFNKKGFALSLVLKESFLELGNGNGPVLSNKAIFRY